jgi:MoaA/NifB/PqqE/SkfB family radical SAM enzyme
MFFHIILTEECNSECKHCLARAAPETLSEKEIRERELKEYVEKAKKIKEKSG